MSNGSVKYSVKARSPVSLLFLIATIVAAYSLPLDSWVQTALVGIAGGVIGGFGARGTVVRSFDPPDAPISAKRKIVALFAFVKLIFGFLIIGFSLIAFSDLLAPAFIALGGYLVGTTAATPLSAKDYE